MSIIQNKNTDYKFLYKIVLIGDSGVGKTNLLSRITRNTFSHDLRATIGVEFATVLFDIGNGIVAKAQIWDTAGQERYRAITSAYYRGTVGALVVYDVTNKSTLQNCLRQWIPQLREHGTKILEIILVGNKTDIDNKCEISEQDGRRVARENGLTTVMTSALSGSNVNEAFDQLMKNVYMKMKAVDESRMRKKVVGKEFMDGKSINKKKKAEKKWCC